MQSGDVNEVFGNRTSSYRLFSRLFFKPLTADEVDALVAMELEKAAADMPEGGLLAEGMNDMGRGLHRRHTGTVRILSTDFTMVFDGVRSYDGMVATPYASIFGGSITGEKAIFFQEPRARDLAAYRAQGIQVDPDLHLPEDHLSFELSFLADLSDAAGEAVEKGDEAEALRLVQASSSFLRDNVLSWYGVFCELALKMVETRFYRGVLKACGGFLEVDLATLRELEEALK